MPTILLTGATGFLGSKLLKYLYEKGYDVVVLKRSTSNTSRINEIINKVHFYDIDIVDFKNAFINHSVDIVIHTATNYGRNSELISTILKTNLFFPLKLLEASQHYGVIRFINTDTLLDDHLNAYTLSKKQFVEWGKRIALENKIHFINLKLEHMYGPDDDESKFVTRILRQLLFEVKDIPLTDGMQKRDFVHVDDVVLVYSLLIECDLQGSFIEFEVGSGKSISIKKMVVFLKESIEQKLHRSLKTELCFGKLPKREGEPIELKANISQLSKLGWLPKVNLIEGLNGLVDSEIKYLNQAKQNI